MTPKFSIIIPVYNVAPYLRECLDSVLSQTFMDWEVICVDDGSTDGSAGILGEYAMGDPRFEVIRQSNCGVSSARNVALDRASGDWVIFLDGDDVWNPRLLELAIKKIEDEEVDVVHFGLIQFNDGENPIWESYECRSVYSGWFVQKVFRRALINDLRFPDYRIGEDTSFMNRVCARARSGAFISKCLYGYRQRSGSASHRPKKQSDIMDILGYASDSLKAYATAIIPVPENNRRLMANVITESVVGLIFKSPKPLRKDLLRKAHEVWREILSLQSLLPRQKLRLRLFGFLPILSTAWILFDFPYRLKIKGFHR